MKYERDNAQLQPCILRIRPRSFVRSYQMNSTHVHLAFNIVLHTHVSEQIGSERAICINIQTPYKSLILESCVLLLLLMCYCIFFNIIFHLVSMLPLVSCVRVLNSLLIFFSLSCQFLVILHAYTYTH